MVTALSVYSTNRNDTTLTTARQFVTVTGSSTSTNIATTCGQSTGYGQLSSQGSTTGWGNAGTGYSGIQAPNGAGFILNSTVLDGQQIIAGTWTPRFRGRTSSGTLTVDLYAVVYLYNGGTYTQIGSALSLTNQTITNTDLSFTFAGGSLPAQNFGNGTGDRLYVECWANIKTNSTGDPNATFSIVESATVGQGTISSFKLDTPGYQPYTTNTHTVPATAALSGRAVHTVPATASLGVPTTAINPYGTTITGALTPARIADLTGIGIGWLRNQVNWGNIETSPGVYTWTTLDTNVSLCNAAGIHFTFAIQNGPSFAQGNLDRLSIPGTLSHVGDKVPAYLNTGAGIWQMAFTGTFSSGTTIVIESSGDGVNWSNLQTVSGNGSAQTIYGDGTNLWFIRARCTALHSGDSVSLTITAFEPGVTNSTTISSNGGIAFAHLDTLNQFYEFTFAGVLSSGSVLAIEWSPDNATWSNVTTITGSGVQPATLFGTTTGGNVYMRARATSWHSGDSVLVTISGCKASLSGKNYLIASNVTSFAQALAHRYTVGDPANAGGLHIEAIEVYNEGADDGAEALLKTPYWMVQALIPTYPAVKAINPAILVGSGAHLQLYSTHISTWQQALYLYGGGPYIDYSQGHYYPGRYAPNVIVDAQTSDVTYDQYWQDIYAVDLANGYPNRPLRIGEFGWPRGIEDSFAANDSNLYTSDAFSTGTLGAWTFDLPNQQLIGTGGSNASYYQTSGAAKFQEGYAEATMNWAEQAGVGLRWVDNNDCYLCLVNDGSSVTSPNTVQVIVRLAGVNTTIASASISFPRGTSHLVHFEAQGHAPVTANTAITVLFDGVQVISTTDTTMQTGGYAFLYQNGRIQCQHFTMIQNGNVTYAQQSQYMQYVFDSSRKSNGVVQAVFWFTFSASDGYSPVSVKNNVETFYPSYLMWQAYYIQYPTWTATASIAVAPINRRSGTVAAIKRRDGTGSSPMRRSGSVSGINRRDGARPASQNVSRRDGAIVPAVRRRG